MSGECKPYFWQNAVATPSVFCPKFFIFPFSKTFFELFLIIFLDFLLTVLNFFKKNFIKTYNILI